MTMGKSFQHRHVGGQDQPCLKLSDLTEELEYLFSRRDCASSPHHLPISCHDKDLPHFWPEGFTMLEGYYWVIPVLLPRLNTVQISHPHPALVALVSEAFLC